MGQAAELLSWERRASKQAAAAVREPLARVAAAAAPLMRYSDPAVAAPTEQLLNACGDVENTRHNLAHWWGEAGDAAGAAKAVAQLLPIVERVRGVEHPDALTVRHNLAGWRGMRPVRRRRSLSCCPSG